MISWALGQLQSYLIKLIKPILDIFCSLNLVLFSGGTTDQLFFLPYLCVLFRLLVCSSPLITNHTSTHPTFQSLTDQSKKTRSSSYLSIKLPRIPTITLIRPGQLMTGWSRPSNPRSKAPLIRR